MSINCTLLGNYSLRDTFAINVCDTNPIGTAQVKYDHLKIEDLKYLIWEKKKDTFGDFGSGRINLWKVNIALGDIAKLKDVTENQIKDNFNGDELIPVRYFKDYFQNIEMDNIHIIVVFTTSKCLPTFYLSNKKFAVKTMIFIFVSHLLIILNMLYHSPLVLERKRPITEEEESKKRVIETWYHI